MSKNHLRILREFIEQVVKGKKKLSAGSDPSEAYNKNLLDDPAYKKASVYVPDDIKNAIDSWADDMGLKQKKDS